MAQKYYLSLNKPALLFFPSVSREIDHGLDGGGNHVVMVTIKGAQQNSIAREMSTFFFLQYEITASAARAYQVPLLKSNLQKAIESIVSAHIFTSFPPEIIVRGRGYALIGKRKPWKYGKSLKLAWGEEQIYASAEKWIFLFELSLDEKDAEGNVKIEVPIEGKR